MVRPLLRFGHLNDTCGISFLTSFASPSSANAMLMNLYSKGVISRRELAINIVVNGFPMIVMHWRSMLPVLIPLLGMVGLAYFMILVLVEFIEAISGLIVGHFLLEKKDNISFCSPAPSPKYNFFELLKKSVASSLPLLKRIILITTPITLVVFMMFSLGLFQALEDIFRSILRFLPLPTQAVPMIVAYLGHHLAGYTVAGNLLAKGVLGAKQIILSLLTAHVLSSVVNIFRWSAPHYLGIFGPKLGTQLMLLSTGLRNLFMVGAIFFLYLFW